MAHVQGTGIQSTGKVTSLAAAYGSNVTSGNTLIAGVVAYNDAAVGLGMTVTNSLGHTYVEKLGFAFVEGATTKNLHIFVAENIGSGAACTVTATPASSRWVSLAVAEISVTKRFSYGSTLERATSTSAQSGDVKVWSADAYLFGIMMHLSAGSPTITPTGTFTQIAEDENTTEVPFNATYRTVSAAGVYSKTWTIGASSEWLAIAAAFEVTPLRVPSTPRFRVSRS